MTRERERERERVLDLVTIYEVVGILVCMGLLPYELSNFFLIKKRP